MPGWIPQQIQQLKSDSNSETEFPTWDNPRDQITQKSVNHCFKPGLTQWLDGLYSKESVKKKEEKCR